MAERTPTFADLCSAIMEGSLPATLNGSMYEVNAFELRRYLNRLRSPQPVLCSDAQTPTHSGDSQQWPASAQTFVA